MEQISGRDDIDSAKEVNSCGTPKAGYRFHMNTLSNTRFPYVEGCSLQSGCPVVFLYIFVPTLHTWRASSASASWGRSTSWREYTELISYLRWRRNEGIENLFLETEIFVTLLQNILWNHTQIYYVINIIA
jgi:hypothetical protein